MKVIFVCNQYEKKEVEEIVKTMICNYMEWEQGKEELRYKFGEAEIEAKKVITIIV